MSPQLFEVAIIGAGPTASSVLERLVTSVPGLLGGRSLRIHLVDPHRAGTGRVWRPDLHPLLWMNSMAEDVTMFTDESVTCAGPVRPGPSLYEWSQSVDDRTLERVATPELIAEIRGLSGMSFPTRRVQSAYLDWFHGEVLAALPAEVEVVTHSGAVVDLVDGDDGRQWVVLDAGADPLRVEVAVLALGHLDAAPEDHVAALSHFAATHGLVHLAPGHTAEQDLSLLEPGADVIALGFGQAFTDLLILVTEGRGGRFVDRGDGTVGYQPSGLEPVLHVGSRRGVPYRSKPDYRLLAPLVSLPRFLDDDAIVRLLARKGDLDFRHDVLPLLTKEAGWAYYHELFVAHPERTTISWEVFAERYAPLDWGPSIDALVVETVPAADDHLDLAALDRPLAGRRFASIDELQRHLRRHVLDDVARRTDDAYSADLGAFMALLVSFGALGRIGASGRLSARSRIDDLGGWWFSFFMYFASGPPPERLRQLLAIADAGLVRFIGADTIVEADEACGRFVARSVSHPDPVVATALVDARIATPSVSRTRDLLLRRLHERGEVVEEVVADHAGWRANTGKVVVSGGSLRIVRADGTSHPRRHGVGVFTNRPAASAFARPRTNAASFRQHDHVARSVLSTLAGIVAP